VVIVAGVKQRDERPRINDDVSHGASRGSAS
jgi:hypothetical protein